MKCILTTTNTRELAQGTSWRPVCRPFIMIPKVKHLTYTIRLFKSSQLLVCQILHLHRTCYWPENVLILYLRDALIHR
jgi:hypothetical protein